MTDGGDSGKTPRLPEKIGPYRILSRLGRGAMGTVYCARDDRMGRDVALKVMTADADGDETIRERFFREARITGRLRHRNIVTVFDMGEDNGRDFIVMELLRGRTLGDWLKDEDAESLEAKLDLMVQACEGLAVAHSAGVIHRDVKPSNLFVLEDGGLKILDFGVARLATSNMTRAGLIIGTPDYMSPEQACGLEIDPRSDIFSLAAVCYLMLTGRRPFDGPDLPIVLHKVVHDDPLPIRDQEAPPALARIVMRALAKPVEQRYASLTEMAADLVRFRRQMDVESRQIVASIQDRFDELRRALATSRELRANLGLPAPTADEQERTLATGYPQLTSALQQGRAPLPSLPRQQLNGLLALVQADLGTTTSSLKALRAGTAALEAAEAANRAGQGRDALHHFQRAGDLLGAEVRRVREGQAAARELLDEQQTQEDRFRELLDLARTECQAGHWSNAAEQLNAILGVTPQHTQALALQREVQAALKADEERRRKRIQATDRDIDLAIGRGDFEQAQRLIELARSGDLNSDHPHAAEQRLAAARVAAAARDHELRLAAEAIAAAQATFDASSPESAVTALEEFVRAHPSAATAVVELRRLRARADELAARAARRAQAQRLAGEAEAHWQGEDDAAAVSSANAALALDGSNVLAQQIRTAADARLKAHAEAAARKAHGDRLIGRAVRSLAIGAYDQARAQAQRALDADGDRPDAAGLLAEVNRLHQLSTAARERERAERERETRVRDRLRVVRAALNTGNYALARWTAEEILATQPNHAEAMELLGRARAASTALGITHDDTVRMTPPPGIHGGFSAVLSSGRYVRLRQLVNDVDQWVVDAWQALRPAVRPRR